MDSGTGPLLSSFTAEALFPGARSPVGAHCGLYLYQNDLDRAHTIAQELHTPEGSFWHGIVHRREPDPGNASYWFRRTGPHPVFPALRAAVMDLAAAHHTAGFVIGPDWDPYAWIRFWESARVRPDSADWRLATAIQRVEWEVLFDYCARNPQS
ncbi:MAG: hypothetical protein R2762_00450 [Bryobacteraceae bacterium]